MRSVEQAIKAYERAVKLNRSNLQFYIDRIAQAVAPVYLLLDVETLELLDWKPEIRRAIQVAWKAYQSHLKTEMTLAIADAALSDTPYSVRPVK